MTKLWRIAPHDQERIAALERAVGVPPVVAQLLLCRGLEDPDEARYFLDAKLTGLRDPETLPGVSEAVKILHAAILAKEQICIYGDYDADGMTSTAILYRCLKCLHANVQYYLPHRIDEGYGLNDEALKTLAERGNKIVITVDCGIASISEALTAKELGLTLIITDHHLMADSIPEAAAVVHPQLPGHDYPFHGLCGAGVAFKLAMALCQQYAGGQQVTDRMRSFLMHAIGLAAIGTVADVVPLTDENRILVQHGLRAMREYTSHGLVELMKVSRINKKATLAADDIGFMLGPRLNAAGRMGQAELGVELLITEDPKRAQELAEYIDELNTTRQSIERSVQREAAKQIKEQFNPATNAALVLAGHGWHAGVIGIVAGRLAELHNRPVVIISLDDLGVKPGTGSGRSVKGIDLHAGFAACSKHLLRHGGHAAAAGLRVEESSLAAFRKAFCLYVKEQRSELDAVAEIQIDAETPFVALTQQTVTQIDAMAPFGQGNARPVLTTSNVTLFEPPKRMGKTGRHLSLQLEQHGLKLRAVAFGKGDWEEPLLQINGPIEIVFRPVINEFRGRRTVEVHLVDWRATEPSSETGATETDTTKPGATKDPTAAEPASEPTSFEKNISEETPLPF